MKTLIYILLFFSLTAQSQDKTYYEGEARVTYQDYNNAVIVFQKSNKSFIVQAPHLKQGKEYYFLIVEYTYRGTKQTAKVIFCRYSTRQKTLDLRRTKDSISQTLKTFWI